jgi:hypothetical protein
MDWPNCIRCQSPRTVPGGISEPAGSSSFVVACDIAKGPSWFQANHMVQLDEIAWLCLDCGLAWQQANAESLRGVHDSLREKCSPEYKRRLFD